MKKIKSYRTWTLAVMILATLFAAIPAYAQTYSVLYDFGSRSGDPLNPVGGPAQGRDGALYGTSDIGGVNSGGTVFKITPAGRLRVLYNFCSQPVCGDGSEPYAGLTLRPDGNFIGTTELGGGFGHGTVFDISESGSLTVLYSFTGGADGSQPMAPPIYANGAFYGTTPFGGGASGCGTTYRIVNTGGGFTILHTFNKTDGCDPGAPLVLGMDGNFYGTTPNGGALNAGVVFTMTPSGKVTVLHSFDPANDGGAPNPLVQGSDGNFYGTLAHGATSGTASDGTVFRITPAGTFTVLYRLNQSGTDGSGVQAGLVQVPDGNFYGAASMGGSSLCTNNDCGTLFQVTPGGSFSVLHNFDFPTGSLPLSAPFQHTNGVLYGVTDGGGDDFVECFIEVGCGVFYSWNAGLPASVSFVPDRGKVGSSVEILGQGFTSSTTVSFNGTPATATVVSGTYLKATVPSGATTGFVTVTTSTGTLTSNKQFIVIP